MATEKVFIDLCGSDEEVDDYGDENKYIEEELEEDTSLSDDDSLWSENDASESDLDHHENDEAVEQGDDDKETAVNKVTLLLKAGSDLKGLNLKECKAYLRNHGLRLAGTKAVCIERIVEHWRLKDGNGEARYPRSSFVINCKGDVCKGDIVLFTQKVHDKYEKMKRSGKVLGRRTVAGQVIKESYGTAKQQHTFTIEVLWSTGIQKLPPLYPLLVKGRNLYRLMTLRQPWANEADRLKVLSEKHIRGAAARRVMRERKIKLGYVVRDGIFQKPVKTKKPGQGRTRKTEKVEQPKGHHEIITDRYRPDISPNHSLDFPNHPSQVRKKPTRWGPPLNNALHSYTAHSHAPPLHQPTTYAPRPAGPPFNIPPSQRPPPPNSYANPTQNQSHQRPPAFYNARPGPTALQRLPAFHNAIPASNVLQGQQAFYNARPAPTALQGQQAFHNARPAPTAGQGQPGVHNARPAPTAGQGQPGVHNLRPAPTAGQGQPGVHNARPTPTAGQGQPGVHNARPASNVLQGHPTVPYENHLSNSDDYNHGMRDLNHFSEMAINHRADRRTYRQSDNTRRANYR